MVINSIKKTRITNQRMKIIEYMKSVTSHPTAETVYRAVKRDMPAITLATVYRNLHILADQGNILRLEINNEYRFDYDTKIHQHFVCRNCGKVIDIHQEEISNYAMKKIKSDDFNPESVRIIFYGNCKKCG